MVRYTSEDAVRVKRGVSGTRVGSGMQAREFHHVGMHISHESQLGLKYTFVDLMSSIRA